MQYRLHSVDSSEINIVKQYPSGFCDSDNAITEEQSVITNDVISGVIKETCIENILVQQINFSTEKDLSLEVAFDFPCVILEIAITGGYLFALEKKSDYHSFSSNQYNVYFSAHLVAHEAFKAEKNIEIIRIVLLPDFVKKLIPKSYIFESFANLFVDKNETGVLNGFNLPVTPLMISVLKEITGTEKTGHYKRMIIESKVIELLMLQFEQYEQYAINPICSTSVRSKDVEKMYKARAIIVENMDSPCTLIDLARKVGTNEYSLKKTFKEVFGTTVFGYLTDIKMNEAKRLLLNTEKSIGEVADEIGYKNPNHFSVAFRKYFGYNPSELRKNALP